MLKIKLLHQFINDDCDEQEDKQQLDRIEEKLNLLLSTTNRVKELEERMDSWLAKLDQSIAKIEKVSEQV